MLRANIAIDELHPYILVKQLSSLFLLVRKIDSYSSPEFSSFLG